MNNRQIRELAHLHYCFAQREKKINNSALRFVLKAWILDIKDKAKSGEALRVLILDALQENGIKLAGHEPG